MADDIDYGTLFGIDEGVKEQAAAEPAEDAKDEQGVEVQEVAEPAEENTDSGTNQPEEPLEQEESGAGSAVQDPKERSKFAAARRKAEAERDAAIEKAKEDAQKEAARLLDEAFKNSGLSNPYTGKPITSKAEYDEYKGKHDADIRQQILDKAGMNDEQFRDFVESLPEVQQAKTAQQEAAQIIAEARQQQAKLGIEEQLRQISALDPAITKLEDLSKMDNYQQFYGMVKSGLTLEQAYKLLNFDRLTGKAAAASRQAAINSVQGKSHLDATSARGAGAASVPADVREAYLTFNPGASDAEIQKHYNKYLKD